MRVSKITWKPSATKAQRSMAYFLIEARSLFCVVPLRKDGSRAYDAMRAPIWLIV
jgi:hypothetical protein